MARTYGVPERTWRAKPTDGLGIGEGDEAQIGATYLEWDITVFAVVDALRQNPFVNEEELLENLGSGEDPVAMRAIAAVLRRLRTTWFKRVNPISLDHPRADRLATLDLVDDRLFRPAVPRDDRALTSFSGEIATLGQRLAHVLAERDIRVVTAESCTAGLVGACTRSSSSGGDGGRSR